jgi:hypothetical protein
MTIAELDDLIQLATAGDLPVLRALYEERKRAALELATRRRPITEPPVVPPPGCVIVDDATIDQWERDTESLERWIEHQRRQAPPPDKPS